ncbi:MAG: thiol-disulfide isomerase/thioredoxin [Parasphingorhabdus sp.]|jgi:thiol-disulfide isomerase/thioredoxin
MRKTTALIVIGLLLILSNPALAAGMFTNVETSTSQSIQQHHEPGKWLVVMMWASDCHICNQEAPEYVEFHTKHKSMDAKILGVSLDGAANKEDAEDFIWRHSINFENLIGSPQEVTGYYSELTGAAWVGTPTFLIFGPQGELRAKQVGGVPTHLIEQFMASNAE